MIDQYWFFITDTDYLYIYVPDNRYSEPIFTHRGTVPHRPLDCFYSNTNKFVQIDDTKIKTERGC